MNECKRRINALPASLQERAFEHYREAFCDLIMFPGHEAEIIADLKRCIEEYEREAQQEAYHEH